MYSSENKSKKTNEILYAGSFFWPRLKFSRAILRVRKNDELKIKNCEGGNWVKKTRDFFPSVSRGEAYCACLVCVNSVEGNEVHMCKQYETLSFGGVVRLSVM